MKDILTKLKQAVLKVDKNLLVFIAMAVVFIVTKIVGGPVVIPIIAIAAGLGFFLYKMLIKKDN